MRLRRRWEMYARKGDRLVVPSPHLGGPVRDAEVLGVRHADGSPPYHVRWSDTGHEGYFDPGPDAYVEHFEHEPEPAPRGTASATHS